MKKSLIACILCLLATSCSDEAELKIDYIDFVQKEWQVTQPFEIGLYTSHGGTLKFNSDFTYSYIGNYDLSLYEGLELEEISESGTYELLIKEQGEECQNCPHKPSYNYLNADIIFRPVNQPVWKAELWFNNDQFGDHNPPTYLKIEELNKFNKGVPFYFCCAE